MPSLSRLIVTSDPPPRFYAIPPSMIRVPPFQSSILHARTSRSRSRSSSPDRSPRRDRRGSPGRRDRSPSRRSRSRSPSPPTISIPSLDITKNEESTPTNVAASFMVPFRMTILSDDTSHQVTIAQIPAEAELEWVCVPKLDTRVYLRVSCRRLGVRSKVLIVSFLAGTDYEQV
jgi:hypothetical protein